MKSILCVAASSGDMVRFTVVVLLPFSRLKEVYHSVTEDNTQTGCVGLTLCWPAFWWHRLTNQVRLLWVHRVKSSCEGAFDCFCPAWSPDWGGHPQGIGEACRILFSIGRWWNCLRGNRLVLHRWRLRWRLRRNVFSAAWNPEVRCGSCRILCTKAVSADTPLSRPARFECAGLWCLSPSNRRCRWGSRRSLYSWLKIFVLALSVRS